MEQIGIVEAARRIRTGDLSAETLVRSCLDSVERRNPELNAFVHVDVDGALAAAAAVDRSIRAGRGDGLGPLAGVPFGVKDLEDCRGMPTTRGSRWYADGPAKQVDSIHVARLRGAGAIPIGKTATPELGAWAYTASPLLGVTRSPWDTSRTPGGSSGGSSAAVSSGMVPFATASDGGGSIREPAAFTGLVGLRASYGRIPTFGDTHLAQNAVVGCLTTSVADTALLLDVMSGPDGRDRTCLPNPPGSYLDALDRVALPDVRVAWSVDLGFAVVDPEVATICEEAARAFTEALGTRLVDRPITLQDYTRIYIGIEGVDRFVTNDRSLWEDRLDEADPLCAPAWTYLSHRTLPEAAAVESARRKLVIQVAEVFDDVDLVLTPMTSVAPFAAEGPMPTEIAGVEVHAGMSVALAFLASVVNLPAVSIPAGITGEGLPIGLQVIGPRFREDLVLAAAARYEAARPWPLHCPDPSR
ncbi:MAG: amidase family protein [Acidimicrobiales bacterium]|jgi:aspartyl-tRNA(Asn)/glutamyl-tRNA(Gln) amidotransferase subunit A